MKKALLVLMIAILTAFLGGCLSKTEDTNNSKVTVETTKVGSISGVAKYKNQSDFSNILITVEKLSSGAVTQSVKRAISLKRSVGIVAYKTTTTDKNGNYKLTGLEEGTYTVYASNQDSTEKAVKTNIEVRANIETTATILQLTPTGNISGKIIVNSKETGNLGYLVCVAGTSYLSVTDDGGNFKIDNIPVGTGYALLVLKGNETKNIKFVDVTQGNTTSAGSVQITTTETTSNTILSDFGLPKDTNGINGDLYFNLDNGDVYKKADNKWNKVTNIKGQNGTTGSSIVWKGTLITAPSNPELNWAYYNSTDKKSYIYTGTNWVILSQDGVDGSSGNSSNGFITIMPEISLEIATSNSGINMQLDSKTKNLYVANDKSLNVYAQVDGRILESYSIISSTSSSSIKYWKYVEDSNTFIYLDSQNNVNEYNLTSKTNTIIANIIELMKQKKISINSWDYISSIKINNSGSVMIFNMGYTNSYAFNLKTKDIVQIPTYCRSIVFRNEQEVYGTDNSGDVYRINLSSGEKIRIGSGANAGAVGMLYLTLYNENIFYINEMTGILNKISIETIKINNYNFPVNYNSVYPISETEGFIYGDAGIAKVNFVEGKILKHYQTNNCYEILYDNINNIIYVKNMNKILKIKA